MKNKSPHGTRLIVILLLTAVLAGILGFAVCYFRAPIFSFFTSLFQNSYRVPDGKLYVDLIDVGQGDAILVRSQDGCLLIDTGSEETEPLLLAYLDACKIKQIDYLILTHPHDDHIGGADSVIRNYSVKKILCTDAATGEVGYQKFLAALKETKTDSIIPAPGDSFSLGKISFTVLGPTETVNDGQNNASLVIRLVYGETSFLFVGDAEEESEKDLLSRLGEKGLDSDFLKLGHHGSYTSTTADFLDAVSPTFVGISCAGKNDYGHPHREVLDRLSEVGLSDEQILRTDASGTATIVSDGKSLSRLP